MTSLVLLAIGGSIVALDQGTKVLAVRFLGPAAARTPRAGRRLELAFNRRGWLAPAPATRLLVLLWALSVASAAAALALGSEGQARGLLGLGLVATIAGATGNLLDRLLRGAVVDFIGLWPRRVFNVADVAIALGLILAFGALG